MRFVFGFAGIPSAVYEQVYKKRNAIVREDGEFYGKPLKDGYAWYDPNAAEPFLKHFHELLSNDHHGKLRDTAFAMICITHDEENTKDFAERFFPSTFVSKINWVPNWGTPKQIAESGNQLITELTDAVRSAKVALEALKKEVNEKANRTPLLLPPKNFRSANLKSHLLHLHETLGADPTATELIAQHIELIYQYHPLKTDEKTAPRFFEDNRGIIFRAPGRAKHAFSRGASNGGHNRLCALNGRRRLGAPYDPGFHYDCVKGKGNLKDSFFECHGSTVAPLEGDPHLNIAPNDFVRP